MRLSRFFHHDSMGRRIGAALMAALLAFEPGCAAIFKGTSQTVVVNTAPRDRVVYFDNRDVKDGEAIVIHKRLEEARVNVGTLDRPIQTPLNYQVEPWIIGDCVLLLFFFLPGAVALGVDFGTGAWREYDNPQTLQVPKRDGD